MNRLSNEKRASIETLEDRTLFSNAESALVTSVAHSGIQAAVGIATTNEIAAVGGHGMAQDPGGIVDRAHTQL